jgi:hypothetical protein
MRRRCSSYPALLNGVEPAIDGKLRVTDLIGL